MNEQEVFTAALELTDPAARASFLDQACGGRLELRSRMEALLRNASQGSRYLESPPDGMQTTRDELITERAGSLIGPYKLLEQIGEGGMGVVYMAQQSQPVKRRVALKLIKPGMDSRQIVARFEAERQALAMMDHPNIARVLDAGATGRESRDQGPGTRANTSSPALDPRLSTLDPSAGRPYFVMELVRGIPITDYCDREKLDTRRRLELLIDVCRAVQHAHQKAIIHRDLKPSNVLVTVLDGVPVVKVIDFGVAKALNQELTERTLFTQFSQMVGTPLYMSPEQAALSAVDVDTRSDVYSLGVLLYELLTGTTPFDKKTLAKAGVDEVRRIIREDDPPRPSSRISTLQAAGQSTVSFARDGDPRKLSQRMSGELDWIVMKALEKDRNRRYESANGFAGDMQRYLNDEPVQACPPSARYRLRKFARRNRTLLTTGCLVGLALIVGTGVSLWQAFEANGSRKLADARLLLANDRLTSEQQARRETEDERKRADNERQRAEGNFEKALALVDQMLTRVGYDHEGREIQAGFRVAGEPMLNRVGKETLQDASQMEQVRRRILDDVLEFYGSFLHHKTDDPRLRHQMARTYLRIGNIYATLGRLKQRDEALLQARRILEELHSQDPQQAEYAMDLAFLYFELRLVFDSEKHQYLCQAAALLEPIFVQQPHIRDSRGHGVRGQLANVYACIGYILTVKGRLYDAEPYIRQAITLCLNDPGWGQDILACSYLDLAILLDRGQRVPEALEAVGKGIHVRKSVVFGSPESAYCRWELANDLHHQAMLLIKAARPSEAEDAYRQALDLWADVAEGFRHNVVRDLQLRLLGLLYETGRAEEAARIADELPTSTTADLLVRAKAHEIIGDFKTALADYEAAAQLEPEKPDSRAAFHSGYSFLGPWLQEFRRLEDAEAVYCKTIAISEKLTAEFPAEPNHWLQYSHSLNRLAKLLAATGRHQEAEQRTRQALTILEKHGFRNELPACHYMLGNLLKDSGRPQEAEQAYRQALADYNKILELNPNDPQAQNGLAWYLATCPDPKLRDATMAVELAKKAVELKPQDASSLNTLGAAQYQAGNWPAAIEALSKSEELAPLQSHPRPRRLLSIEALSKSEELAPGNYTSFNAFFLAMAHWQLGNKVDARKWYDQAVPWMEKNAPADVEVRLFREEAEKLLGVKTEPKSEKELPPSVP